MRGGVRWLERAAGDGQPVAAEYLGMLYATGTGVDANMAQAVHWYSAAAQLGNVAAMTNLGKAYAGAWPGHINYAKAAHWFYAAARFGDVDAQFDLAILYERGAGAPHSAPDAYAWYSIAAAQGDRDSAAHRVDLAAELPADALRAAQKFAAAFKVSSRNPAANEVPKVSIPRVIATTAR